jgi:hypothetical protein
MKSNLRICVAAALAAGATITLPGLAGQVTNLVSFTANTPAKAGEVNGNFTAVKTAVDDNDARIGALITRVAALEAQLTNVTALNAYLSLQTVNGHPTVRVTAANFQVVNGKGNTDSVDGLGNLIVGYDELRPEGPADSCSKFLGDAAPTKDSCEASGGTWAKDHKSGSHNLVVGSRHNYPSYGGAVFGTNNFIGDAYANVTGGQNNIAVGPLSNISGGNSNFALGLSSSVSGGYLNLAAGESSSVAGGETARAEGKSSFVGGGYSNVARGTRSSVTGGLSNLATGPQASVAGGNSNTASGQASAVSGGLSHQSAASNSWSAGAYYQPN